MKTNKKGTNYFFFVVFILLYSLFYRPVNGDFWSYLEGYNYGAYSSEHMEPFYQWLMVLIPNNYMLWRIAIWLPAAIIIAIVSYLSKIPNSHMSTFFLVFGLAAYYYTRNALALSVLYLGMMVFCVRDQHGKKMIGVLLFALFAYASWFLHKSMPMYIGIASLSLLLPLNKRVLVGGLIAFPLLYGVVMLIGSGFIQETEIWIREGVGTFYLEAENEKALANWKGVIYTIIQYSPVVYFCIISFFKPISKDDPDFEPFKIFLIFSFITIYLSFLFWGQGSVAIQGRFYKSAMIPFSFVVALYFKHYLGSKQCNIFIYLYLFRFAMFLIFA